MSGRHLDRRALLLAGAGVASTAAVLTFAPAEAGTTVTKKFTGTFTPANKEDWVYLPFVVPKGVKEVRVSYTYPDPIPGPGYSSNVIDIGIFDSSGNGLGNAAGFRGWSGGARKAFRISRTAATPGYLAGPISPGRWKVALGPYQIVSRIKYEVKVTLVFGKPGAPFVPDPAPTTATPTEQKTWWRGDLHVHTVHSDGSQTQPQVLVDARAAGLDFIGSSDHNTDSAQLTWGRYVEDDFLVIAGEEVTTRAGHWVATGLPAGTWIDWRYRPEDGELATFTQQVRDLGGIAIAAHPNIPVPSIRWDFGDTFAEMDAVEVWNGPWDSFDGLAVTRWHQLLSAGTFKPAVGNSDSHNHGQQIGLAQTVVRADGLSTAAVIAGYRAGHAWVAESSAVDLVFTASLDDVSGECGDHVPSSEGDEVAVHLEVTGVPGCTAFLYGPGTKSFGSAAAGEDGTITLDRVVPGGTAFVRAEVRRGTKLDPMVALTNPIFLT
ncbi:CehA/McbA family metallohydrolase [Nocardioides sp.]|uniref:CehA/McbA family metallohydrolase n=1 Tax=Nocardioides sp. TaxID=35761 RepID=UPI0037839B1D